jgi:murein DD-endopeptidase MepM/ murein hydrolase activator NlpD
MLSMKHWTVMLIPHGEGTTRSLNLYALHVWLVIGLFAVLTFSSTFTLQLYRTTRGAMAELEQENRDLAVERARLAAQTVETGGSDVSGLSDQELEEVEERLREGYEEELSKITAEMSELYELEKRIRKNANLPPRTKGPVRYSTGSGMGQGGRGGPDADPVNVVMDAPDRRLLPPTLTYGLSRPSADLNFQEILIRIASFRELVKDMDQQIEEINRMPADWPSRHRLRRLTSGFGNRRDPFSGRLRHHAGIDISAPYRSTVVSTGQGTVTEAQWDSGGLGNMVRIDHGKGRETVYGHLSRFNVTPGQKVSRGDKIGEVGSTGKSSGNHIHYEVRINGRAVNPMKYIK